MINLNQGKTPDHFITKLYELVEVFLIGGYRMTGVPLFIFKEAEKLFEV